MILRLHDHKRTKINRQTTIKDRDDFFYSKQRDITSKEVHNNQSMTYALYGGWEHIQPDNWRNIRLETSPRFTKNRATKNIMAREEPVTTIRSEYKSSQPEAKSNSTYCKDASVTSSNF